MSASAVRMFPLALLLAPAIVLAAPSSPTVTDPSLPRALTAAGPVQVTWEDPAGFTEIRYSGNRHEARKGTWVSDLADYLASESATALAPGQRLTVNLTDIDLAGDFEPWLGRNMQEVRMMRDIYPPKIALSYTLHDANGQVLAQGDRTLSNLGYLQGLNTARKSTDNLRYEKHLIDRWVQQEFGPNAKLTANK